MRLARQSREMAQKDQKNPLVKQLEDGQLASRYSDELGYWDLRDNFVGEGVTWSTTEDTLANADDWQSTATFPASELTYSVTPDSAECVKQLVSARAGATRRA